MCQANESRAIHGHRVHGIDVDPATRCAHYHGDSDVIAIRFYCCDAWYPCIDCHAALADHRARPWPAERRDAGAVLCGVCGQVLTIDEYLGGGSKCPTCSAAFNPGCARHYPLYFDQI